MNRYANTGKNSKGWRGSRWTALANSVRSRNPICERCKERFSEEVHHSVPLHKGGSLFDPRNLVALCKDCHHQITSSHIAQIRAAKFAANNELTKNPIILTEQRPFFANNEGMAEASCTKGTTVRVHSSIDRKKLPRESLGARLKWRNNKIK